MQGIGQVVAGHTREVHVYGDFVSPKCDNPVFSGQFTVQIPAG